MRLLRLQVALLRKIVKTFEMDQKNSAYTMEI